MNLSIIGSNSLLKRRKDVFQRKINKRPIVPKTIFFGDSPSFPIVCKTRHRDFNESHTLKNYISEILNEIESTFLPNIWNKF